MPDDSQCHRYPKTFFCFIAPFVPEDLITVAWHQLRPTLPQGMATSIDYYERTWVGTARPAATPALSIWAFLQSLKSEQNITDVKKTKLREDQSCDQRS